MQRPRCRSERTWEAFARIVFKNKIMKISKNDEIVDIRNGGHQTRFGICNKRGKPIYIETESNALDGGQANHKILEGHLRHEVAHRRQTYQHNRLFVCGWSRRNENCRSTSGYVTLSKTKPFRDIANGNKRWHNFKWRRNTWAASPCTRAAIWLR